MGSSSIVGLGPGAVGHLSLETMGLLQNCGQVILRTAVVRSGAELASTRLPACRLLTRRILRRLQVLVSIR